MTTPKTASPASSQVASSGAIVAGRSSGGMPSTRTPPQTISSTRIAEGYSSRRNSWNRSSMFASSAPFQLT